MHGAKGEVWGCEIVITNKVRDNARTREKNYFIVKPGALRLVNKQGALVEIQREPEFMRDNIFASRTACPICMMKARWWPSRSSPAWLC